MRMHNKLILDSVRTIHNSSNKYNIQKYRMKDKQQKIKYPRWSQQQKLYYFFYLVIKAHQLGDERGKTKDSSKTIKNKKFFKIMEAFIKTRDARQCISHNQKKLKKEVTYKRIIQGYFREFYLQRYIKLDHLTYEIRQFLEEKVKEKVIDQNQKNKLLKQAEQNINSILYDIYQQQKDDDDQEDEEEKKIEIQEQPNQENGRQVSLIFEPQQTIHNPSSENKRNRYNPDSVSQFLNMQQYQSNPLSCYSLEIYNQDISNRLID